MAFDDSGVETSTPVAVGMRLGKYLVTEKLGEGGMGVVFAGVHEQLGRQVAIKLLRVEFAKDELVLQRFQQEAEAVSRIGHAHIVAVYDFGRAEDGSVYYVMERIAGETLTRRLRHDPPLTPQETVTIFAQICRALQAAHARNIVHRDLKPDNVLLQAKESGVHAKLVDFGVAKMREDRSVGAGSAEGNLTKSGTLLGTPTYMAPEQITQAKNVDGRADLYSLGAMLYEVLTGQPPHGRGQMIEVLTRHVRDPVVPPSLRAPDKNIPPALDNFILRSLAKKPEERQPDANAFIAELEEAWGVKRKATQMMTAVMPGGAPAVAPTPAPVAAVKRWPIAAAVGALLLVGGGAAYFFLHKPAGKPTVENATAAAESALHIEAGKIIDTALAGDATARRETIEALGEVGDRSALDRIVNALADDNPEVRRAAAVAAVAVGKPDDEALKRALAEAAGRSGGAVAVELAASRVALGDAAAQDDLKKAMSIHDGAARLRAAVALADAGQLPAAQLHAAVAAAPPTARRSLRWAAYARLFKLHDEEFLKELRAAVAGKDPAARLDAAQALAREQDTTGLLALAEIAKAAADPVDRVEAAAIQAELGDAAAREALVAALAAPSPTVRARAAAALGRLAASLAPAEQDALAADLKPLLADPDRGPRIAAAAALLAVPDHPNAQRTAKP